MELLGAQAPSRRLLLVLVLVGAGVFGSSCRGRVDRPAQGASRVAPCPSCNVILISIDTLSAKHLASYGYHRDTSPNLDRFAEESVLFDQSIGVGGGTLPVHTSMMTSLHPRAHGVLPAVSGQRSRLPEGRTTLAERLREAGFATAAFTDRGWMRAQFGLDEGFERYDDEGGHLEAILPKIGAWLEQHRDRRFFLFVHTYDVHSETGRAPYRSPMGFDDLFADSERRRRFRPCRNVRVFDRDPAARPEGENRRLCSSRLLQRVRGEVGRGFDVARVFTPEDIQHLVDLYDGGIAYTDTRVAELFDMLQALGLWDRSIVVVTSDHGEEFFQHRGFLHGQNFEEVARVPLMIRFPQGAHGGARISELVTSVDLAPTLLAAVGLEPLPASQGLSLLPLLEEETLNRDGVHVFSRRHPKMRTRERSLVLGPGAGEPIALYDLTVDPWETEPIEDPIRASALAQRYRELSELDHALRSRFATESREERPAPHSQDREVTEELRALGYLGEETTPRR